MNCAATPDASQGANRQSLICVLSVLCWNDNWTDWNSYLINLTLPPQIIKKYTCNNRSAGHIRFTAKIKAVIISDTHISEAEGDLAVKHASC